LATASPVLFQVAPGLRAEALAFPESGISEALGATNDDAVDVPLQASASRRETELIATGLAGAQIEPRCPQPLDHAVLHDMATLENAQQAPGVTPMVDRRLGKLVLQRTFAGHSET
jgi:hypothetical protein